MFLLLKEILPILPLNKTSAAAVSMLPVTVANSKDNSSNNNQKVSSLIQ